MSSSAIPHVISFLTRPLLAAFPAASVTSAQLILSASLASSATSTATFTLSAASSPPAPLLAASIGAGIPWPAWCTALAGGDDVPVLLFYGPGYLKVRVGDAPVADVWSEDEDARGSVVRISQVKVKVKAVAPLLQQSTGARLRGALLSARVRNLRRQEAALIRLPSLVSPTADADDCTSEAEESDSDSGSDCSTTSSKFSIAYSSAESRTSAASSPPASPPKAPFLALPAPQPKTLPYRAPGTKTYRAPSTKTYRAPKMTKTKPTTLPAIASSPAKRELTAYLYQGGVTRVMTGGVMLGPRPAAHVVRFVRS